MRRSIQKIIRFAMIVYCSSSPTWAAASAVIRVAPDWTKVVATSKTQIAMQDCPEPPLFRGELLHDKLYKILRDFQGNYSRFQAWYPYPKAAVAELSPPDGSGTHWNFTLMDELVEDFMKATAGHPVVFQPGTIPAWMTSAPPPTYPQDPKRIDWAYGRDGKILDATVQQFADYQCRVARWYIKGGFEDENGQWHASNHHYKFDYWEPMNEEDQRFSPAELTRLYDAAVASVHQVDPSMKFVGPTLANTAGGAKYIVYFLDPRNHKPGTPIDMIAYHFYAVADADMTTAGFQYSMFKQADILLAAVGYIEAIRKQLMPDVPTDIDELGSILDPPKAPRLHTPIPKSWWMQSGAVWAYLYGNLAAQGIDVLTAAELIDYPGQFAGTTLVDWSTGTPNARYWVTELLNEQFGPGDKIIAQSHVDDMTASMKLDFSFQLYAQAFATAGGMRKILLVNKRDHTIDLVIAGAAGGTEQHVEEATTSLVAPKTLTSDYLRLPPSAVSIVSLP